MTPIHFIKEDLDALIDLVQQDASPSKVKTVYDNILAFIQNVAEEARQEGYNDGYEDGSAVE